MATETHKYAPILGKRIRLTVLDKCGNVPTEGAEDSTLVTDGFISVQLSAEVEEGNEITTKKADGSFCVNEKTASSFKNFGVEIELCGVNPSALSILTNAEIYEDYKSNPTGFVVPEGTIDKQLAFELWTGMSGQVCEPGAEEASGYFLLPFIQGGVLSDVTIDGENAVNISMTGAYTKGQNGWGVGPYNVLDNGGVPSPLPTALDKLDHMLAIPTMVKPPEITDGLVPFTVQAAPVPGV